MPHDPKARPAAIGSWKFIDDPTYGRGAYRDITYEDGTIERRFNHFRTPEEEQQQGNLPADSGYLIQEELVPELANTWDIRRQRDNPQPAPPQQQTPEQQALAQQAVAAGERKAAEDAREATEKQWNADHGGKYETNNERSVREQRELAEARAVASDTRQQRLDQINAENQRTQNQLAQGQLALGQGNLAISQAREQREANKPDFLSQANADNPNIVRWNPQTAQMESIANPNFDAVKQQSERMRQLLASQIQARQVTLDEAKQQYSQWYDTNVKIPLAQAQEARDKAAEQRAALDAEERRRQFASNFSLQKGQLGERAGEAAMQAEQSLLPYRAGPTESAEMSSAINSLGAGGSMSTNASAGIHFTPEAFQFNAPDFKSIAKQAAKAALSGISSYIPSDDSYQTADYSSVPAVNAGSAPSVPQGYGAFQDIINNLQSTYQFGGGS